MKKSIFLFLLLLPTFLFALPKDPAVEVHEPAETDSVINYSNTGFNAGPLSISIQHFKKIVINVNKKEMKLFNPGGKLLLTTTDDIDMAMYVRGVYILVIDNKEVYRLINDSCRIIL